MKSQTMRKYPVKPMEVMMESSYSRRFAASGGHRGESLGEPRAGELGEVALRRVPGGTS